MKIAYYPGCSNHGTSREFEKSAFLVLGDLGVELEEVPDWICCGASPGHHSSKLLSTSLGAYNLKQAEPLGLPVMTTCAACYHRLSHANHEVAKGGEYAAKVNEAIDDNYDGGVKIEHLLELFHDDIGLKKIDEQVRKPLKGLKVACYYGCLLTRPPEYAAVDETENPVKMEALMLALGAEPVEWSHRTECCGASFPFSGKDIVHELSGSVLVAAQKAGADCVAVACPMCHANLDMRQSGCGKAHNTKIKLPIIYITELMGLAFGHKPKELGLNLHSTSTKSVTTQVG